MTVPLLVDDAERVARALWESLRMALTVRVAPAVNVALREGRALEEADDALDPVRDAREDAVVDRVMPALREALGDFELEVVADGEREGAEDTEDEGASEVLPETVRLAPGDFVAELEPLSLRDLPALLVGDGDAGLEREGDADAECDDREVGDRETPAVALPVATVLRVAARLDDSLLEAVDELETLDNRLLLPHDDTETLPDGVREALGELLEHGLARVEAEPASEVEAEGVCDGDIDADGLPLELRIDELLAAVEKLGKTEAVIEESALAVSVAAEVALPLALTTPVADVAADVDGDPETLPPALGEAAAVLEEDATLEELTQGDAVGDSDTRDVGVTVLPADAVVLAPPETLGDCDTEGDVLGVPTPDAQALSEGDADAQGELLALSERSAEAEALGLEDVDAGGETLERRD